MILIADSGSTKTDWVLVDDDVQHCFRTLGYNPYFMDSDAIFQSLNEKLLPYLDAARVSAVFFYGAGCSLLENNQVVELALMKCFDRADIHVGHDMLAAARALLGHQPGFAAILGTGSNTCLYDGKVVTHNIDSLGYLLGDEGSGSYIGRKIVRDYLRNALPADLQNEFHSTWNLSSEDIFNRLYHGELPNRFLAGFCEFAHKHREHIYSQKIVIESFREFFNNLVARYPDFQTHTFNCIGSVGFIFSETLQEVATEFGMRIGKIINTPIQNLVEFHLLNRVNANEKEVSNNSGG